MDGEIYRSLIAAQSMVYRFRSRKYNSLTRRCKGLATRRRFFCV